MHLHAGPLSCKSPTSKRSMKHVQRQSPWPDEKTIKTDQSAQAGRQRRKENKEQRAETARSVFSAEHETRN
ncbi:hypothetical protein BD289DRAFT_425574 [Coniella lustricola]|uniref:Uncharacterized protein n=1 Tax=Coniella lustricola TaxID=2025994 RepID=A0A2T3AHF9_9PEZI|nr:hypothetical protein BD289DRAFT_425574 [Coniella lustricola]